MIQLIRTMKSALAAAAGLGLGLMLAGQGAQAAVGESVFYWNGNCEDCALEAGTPTYGVTGILTLSNDYELGDPITLGDDSDPENIVAANFVSFAYSGSNLVHPFTAFYVPAGDPFPDSGLGHYGAYAVAGQINTVPGTNHFEVDFLDGHFFRTQVDAAWSMCAPGDNGLYTTPGLCFPDPPAADFGNAAQFTTTPVPEPEIWVMFGAGLGLVAFMRRRRMPIAG